MVRIYDYNSSYYMQELMLRNKILRQPLGMNLYDEDLSKDKSDIHIGAFSEGKLVGCLLLSKLGSDTIKMRQVAVDTIEQKGGIGSQMVRFSEEWARKNNYFKITMHARKSAVAFYEKHGYMTIGNEFHEVSVPHFKMVKTL